MGKKKASSKTNEHGNIDDLRKEIDSFKFQIDEFCEKEIPDLGATSSDRLTVYERATDLTAQLAALNKKLDALSLSEAGIPTKTFESKKTSEKQRLNKLQLRLDQISDQLEPDEVEEDYFRTLELEENDVVKTQNDKFNEKTEPVNENSEEYIEEEESEEGDSNESDDDYIECYAETLTVYRAEQDGDLSFEKGEHLTILEQSEDGWWTAKNKAGKKGVVPSTLIKIVDADGPKGEQLESPVAKRSGKQLWNILKEKKPISKETSINDVLKALKAVPSGFRSPTLGTWYQKDENKIASWVVPKTTPSKLQFRDLHWDGINKKLRLHPVNVCRTFSFMSVRCIPVVGAGVEILSRHVYVALWDEEKIVSNIHLIRALERDTTWTFTPKIGKNIPSLYDGEFLVRINSDDRKLSILFEFNYTYKRTSTSEQSDICCGWASLPLFELDGTPLPNKTFEININGGTPYEKGVPLDPTTNLDTSETLFQSLIRSNQQPRMTVKSTSMNKASKDTCDMLPAVIVACQKYSPFIGFYRQHAAMMLCREDHIPTEHICDPLLSHFPRALMFPALMDALKLVWDEKVKNSLNRSQRKNSTDLLKIFKQSFMESAFGLMQCANIPPFIWGDDTAEKARNVFIQAFLQHKNNSLGNLLSADYRHKPLDVSMLTFDVISKHSIDPPVCDRNSLTM